MFNKIYINETSTEYVPYEKTVNINKPSTAEDLELVKKIREEAESDIIASFRLENNLIKDARVLVYNDPLNSQYRLIITVKINGVDIKEEGSICRGKVDIDGSAHLIKKLQEILANLLANNILNNIDTKELVRII